MYPKTQQVIANFLTENVMPGVSYAFIKEGQVATYTAGYAQLEPEKEVLTPAMLFDVASLTKVICTTTLVLKLVEQKYLTVEDRLQKYLPEFQDPQVTIRQLLTHTAAINADIENRDQLTAAELKSAMLKLKSTAERGQSVVYTDTGTVLLGFMLEKIYQQNLHLLFQQKILEPLGMKASTFTPTRALAVPTEVHLTRGLIRGEVHDPKAYTLQADCGSAGLFTNLADCLLFVNMLLNDGKLPTGEPFLTKATVQGLLRDQTPTNHLKRSLGWDLKRSLADQHPLLFHTGYTGTFLLIDISEGTAFIFLSNRVHPKDYRKEYLQKRDYLVATYLAESAFN